MPGNAGLGRPKGSRNKRTVEMLELAAKGETPVEFGLRIMRDETATLEQRIHAARIAAPFLHIRPAPSAEPVVIELPETDTIAGVSRAADLVLRAVTAGKVPANIGRDLMSILDVKRKGAELLDMERRLEALERMKEGNTDAAETTADQTEPARTETRAV